MTAQQLKARTQADGNVLVTLKYPDLIPVLQSCAVAATRRRVSAAREVEAYGDNLDLVAEGIRLRKRIAALLGYESWAALATETRMSGSPANIDAFAGPLAARVAAGARADLDAEKKRLEDVAKKREDDFQQRLVKATQENLEKARSQPTLLAKDAQAKQAAKSKWFEARESAAKAAAQYRSLDPAKWADVVADIGGLDAALEEIRRRVWTPLCAPAALLDELGAERLKGVLLYGPPGCGKSYLAARLAKGLSRRAVTVVSGPEIMDKYVGSSEAQLRELFTNPPKVEPRVGDAPELGREGPELEREPRHLERALRVLALAGPQRFARGCCMGLDGSA